MRSAEVGGGAVPYRWLAYGACVVAALLCCYVPGKDLAWDTLNYHLYLGFSALNDRFGQDYFAAGLLSYLNPYAYAPFYLLVRAGLPALAIGAIFAALQSMILWLTFELGLAVCPSREPRARVLAGACAAALAFMNPVLIQQLGSCFADITTAELALAGWLLLAGAVRVPRLSRIVFAGLILGAASALKLSNALPAASAFAMLIFLPIDWRGRIRHGVLFGLSLGLGFAAVAADWAYRLEREFGNPLFPMFNNFFRSPQFTAEPLVVYRFVPASLLDALWRPFAMLNPVSMVHEELRAPDPRYAIIVVLGLLFVIRWVRRRASRSAPRREPHPAQPASTRVLAALGTAFGVHFILWLLTSGNSRYVLTMACVAAAVIVGMLFRLFESRPKVRNYLLGIIFATQAVQLSIAGEYRWNAVPWGGPWFDVSVPDKLKTEANLYLTFGLQSNSFIAPFIAKDSGLINFAGGYTLDAEGANGAHVKALIRKFSPHVRVLFAGGEPYKNIATQSISVPDVDDALQRWGLRADMSDCTAIIVHGLPPTGFLIATSTSAMPKAGDTTYLATCRVVPDLRDQSALLARQREVDAAFDHLEDACPALFRPRRLVTLHDGYIWRRLYGGTDISAWISGGRLKFADLSRPNGVTDLGPEGDWSKAALPLECGMRDGVHFAKIIPSNR